VGVIENIADTIMSGTFTRKFQSIEAIIFLYETPIVPNYFEKSPLEYISVSAQK